MIEGWSKYILRLSMEDILPRETAWRKDKKGFQAPSSWITDSKVRDLIETSISYLQQNNYIGSPDKNNYWKYIMIYQTCISSIK
jgi:asparagine synthase (glutamine-hydrolysing)